MRAMPLHVASQSRRPGRPKGLDPACREKLLASALSAFSRHGFEGVSLRTITTEAGFDVSMIAHHFGSKAELWRAVVDEVAQDHEALRIEINELRSTIRSLEIRVTAVLDRMIDHLANHPETSMFVTREIWAPSERLGYLVEKLLRPSIETHVSLWREALDAGLIRPINPVVLHFGLFSGVAMILASRSIIAQLGGGDIDIAQLKAEVHSGLLGMARDRSSEPLSITTMPQNE